MKRALLVLFLLAFVYPAEAKLIEVKRTAKEQAQLDSFHDNMPGLHDWDNVDYVYALPSPTHDTFYINGSLGHDLDCSGTFSTQFIDGVDIGGDRILNNGRPGAGLDHGYNNNDLVMLRSTGTLPSPLATLTAYYVVNRDAAGFQLSTTPSGAAIDITDAGTGTHGFHDGGGTDHCAWKTHKHAWGLGQGGNNGLEYGETFLTHRGKYTEHTNLGYQVGDPQYPITIGNYGDGEVVHWFTWRDDLSDFTLFDGNVYKATINSGGWAGMPANDPGRQVAFVVMDHDFDIGERAIAYEGTDDSGVDNKTTSMTDTVLVKPGTSLEQVTEESDFGYYSYNNIVCIQGVGNCYGYTDFVGAYIFNETDGSWGVVTSVTSSVSGTLDTLNFAGGLQGGIENDFDSGDEYTVAIMGEDGTFYTINDDVYLRSDFGDPDNRDLIVNPDGKSNDFWGWTDGSQNTEIIGGTFVGAPSSAIYFGYPGMRARITDASFFFNGRSGIAQEYSKDNDVVMLRDHFHGNVMMNYPRGLTYGGNGGWPNGMSNNAWVREIIGCISTNNGGEGNAGSHYIAGSLFVDNYSMNVYLGGNLAGGLLPRRPSGNRIEALGNVVITTRLSERAHRALDPFYLMRSYNGLQRNYVKMWVNGITTANESVDVVPTEDMLFANNFVAGAWLSLNSYWELPNSGWNNMRMVYNTVVMGSEDDVLPYEYFFGGTQAALYQDFYGIVPYARQGIDAGGAAKNNVFINSNDNDGRKVFVNCASCDNYTLVESDNNYYYQIEDAPKFKINGTIYDFATWKSITGWDSNSILQTTPNTSILAGTDADWGDPGSIHWDDIQLVANSPIIDAGADLTQITNRDFFGNVRPAGVGYDIGAIEYGASPPLGADCLGPQTDGSGGAICTIQGLTTHEATSQGVCAELGSCSGYCNDGTYQWTNNCVAFPPPNESNGWKGGTTLMQGSTYSN